MDRFIRNATLSIYAVLGVCLIFVTVQVSDVLSEASRQGLPLITKTENILDTTNQTITVVISATATSAITWDTGVFDLVMTSSTGVATSILAGTFAVFDEGTS